VHLLAAHAWALATGRFGTVDDAAMALTALWGAANTLLAAPRSLADVAPVLRAVFHALVLDTKVREAGARTFALLAAAFSAPLLLELASRQLAGIRTPFRDALRARAIKAHATEGAAHAATSLARAAALILPSPTVLRLLTPGLVIRSAIVYGEAPPKFDEATRAARAAAVNAIAAATVPTSAASGSSSGSSEAAAPTPRAARGRAASGAAPSTPAPAPAPAMPPARSPTPL
jgi:hypothetical protein